MTPPPHSRRWPTPSRTPQGRALALEQLEDRTVLSTSTLNTALGEIVYDTENVSTSSILVAFSDTNTDYTGYSALAGTVAQTRFELLPGYYLVQVDAGVSLDDALQAYADSGLTTDVSPDYLLSTQATPNDLRYGEQWGLDNASGGDINASAAWNVTKGSTKITVSVMDTGIDYNHPDLYKNIWINQGEIPTAIRSKLIDIDSDGLITFYDLNDSRNQGVGKITDQNGDKRISADDILAAYKSNGLGGWADGVSNNGDAYKDDLVGWNFINNTNRPYDDNGHGTHVSGIIGAQGNNGTGVTGVAWVTQLMAVKFMNANGQGSIGSYIAGLDYAVARGSKISNNSWAGGTFTTLLYDAINKARGKGHIYVAAAGNASTNIDTNPSYPASYDVNNVVVVASSSRTGALNGFSNYGVGTVDVAAPGDGILSTLPGNRYGYMTGTSMATPMVTGTLALVWAAHPTWSYSQVINQVLSTADKVSALTGKVATGARVDAAGAVGAATSSVGTTAPKVVSSTASGTDTNTLNKITVAFTKPMNATTMKTTAAKLVGPSGKTVSLTSVKAVAGSNNTKWEFSFLTQNTPGTYSFQLTNALKDTEGNALANYYTTFSIAKTATYTSKQSVSIKDTSTVASTIYVNQSAKVSNITVKVNIGHTYDSDLAIYLVAPNGRKVLLAYRRGGSGDNFTNTVFTDASSKSISNGTAPFTGSYKPEQLLSGFKNVPTLGTWKLLVQDMANGDVGTVIKWSMTITTTNGQTLSTQSVGEAASIQGYADPDVTPSSETATTTPATQTTDVSGPALVGMQLVWPLGDRTTTAHIPAENGTATQETPTNAAWLAREVLGIQPTEEYREEEQPNSRSEEEYTPTWSASDAVFEQPLEETAPASVPSATTTTTTKDNEEVDPLDPLGRSLV